MQHRMFVFSFKCVVLNLVAIYPLISVCCYFQLVTKESSMDNGGFVRYKETVCKLFLLSSAFVEHSVAVLFSHWV